MNSQFLYLFISIFLGAGGQILLKFAVNRIGEINLAWPSTLNTILHIFTDPWVISGIVCFVSSMILWIKVLSHMELSKAYPSVSLSYLLVFLFSVLLFQESISTGKVIGLILVSVGVYFLHV